MLAWKCCLRRNKELISWLKSGFNFEGNSWPLDFTSSTVILDEQRPNQTIWVKEKASVASNYSNSDQDCTRGKNVGNVESTTTVAVSTNIQPQVQWVNWSIYYPNQNASDPSRKPM